MPGNRKGTNRRRNPVPRKRAMPNENSTTASAATPIAVKAWAYLGLQQQLKEINKQLDALKPELEEYLEEHKVVSETGSYEIEIPYAGQKIVLAKTERKTSVVAENAIKIIRRQLPGIADELIESETITVVRKDKIPDLVLRRKITEEQVRKFVTVEKTYAFAIKKRS